MTEQVETWMNQLIVGRLRATVPAAWVQQNISASHAAQLDMIERHILRIEAALQRAGIPFEDLPL